MEIVGNGHLVKTNPIKANFSTPKVVEKKTENRWRRTEDGRHMTEYLAPQFIAGLPIGWNAGGEQQRLAPQFIGGLSPSDTENGCKMIKYRGKTIKERCQKIDDRVQTWFTYRLSQRFCCRWIWHLPQNLPQCYSRLARTSWQLEKPLRLFS